MKTNVYEILTNEIIEIMESGTIPWSKPWQTMGGMPQNWEGKRYRGGNAIILGMKSMLNDWTSPTFLTFKQAKNLGGSVKKGEKSTMIVHASIAYPKEFWGRESECPANLKRFVVRYFRVFNLDQTEGVTLPPRGIPAPSANHDHSLNDTCEAIIKGMQNAPTISRKAANAYYVPSKDKVFMPPLKTFNTAENFYSTMFHELAHSTGHESRLDRAEGMKPCSMKSDSYAMEELVAELAASFICGHAGIVESVKEQSAAYLKGWLKALKDDKDLFFKAASQAQKAADYILGTTFDNE